MLKFIENLLCARYWAKPLLSHLKHQNLMEWNYSYADFTYKENKV